MGVIPIPSQGSCEMRICESSLSPFAPGSLTGLLPIRGVGAGCQADSHLKGIQKVLSTDLVEGASLVVVHFLMVCGACAAASVNLRETGEGHAQCLPAGQPLLHSGKEASRR